MSERECRRTAEAANRNFETCILGRAGRFPTNSGVSHVLSLFASVVM